MGGMREHQALPPFHKLEVEPRAMLNRVHAVFYTCAILLLFYHRSLNLFHSISFCSFSFFLSLLLSDIILAFMWSTTQAFRWRPVRRWEYLENLARAIDDRDFPALDTFICTADPYKEPPMGVINTALSVMAFDYPTDKMSVYVSDDGGSELTLYALMEAAKFAKHWVPFCRENKIEVRCPEVYFQTADGACSDAIKVMYESMKDRVERVLERGHISEDQITSDEERNAFKKWSTGFAPQDHPTIIQVLLESSKDRDVTGYELPNLVYLSREKSKSSPHHFKAGALNALVRVSAEMSNAPVILTLDCDMYSNDPQAPRRAMCYIMDRNKAPKLAFVQFPQYFHCIDKNDIYGCEYKRALQINQLGMDGLLGPEYAGTGSFFQRKAFHGPPSLPELEVLDSHHRSAVSLRSRAVLSAAQHVASCTYENGTNWGSKVGFRYGSLVEDYYTDYRLHSEGWESVFCKPTRPAFLGDMPIHLNDVLSQNKRWCIGLLDVVFSKYNPLTFGITRISFLMGMCYAHYAYWATWAVPITIYGFLPQLALLNGITLFPKVSDPWFYLYIYLFVGGYGQDLIDFLIAGGTIKRWWNDQRMWMIRGVSSYPFALIQFTFKLIGISDFGFNVTSKVIDDEQRKRYKQGIFEFGVASPLFVPLATVAIINLISFIVGASRVLQQGKLEDFFVQLFISGFVMANCWPIYEAMVLRRDRGRIPMKTMVISIFLAWVLYLVASITLKI
ncbi:cellulose synthase-like protein G3 isoform X2 [Tasmannia lanceolata]|uniref:cellulose synthase-like protein G3 isoform X2 n=1 Tax=Tasmannia lanceolata TaxID=3420 RepID=UPI004063C08B